MSKPSKPSLKQILFNIARLPSSDQRWILHRLSSAERDTLKQFQGLKLLLEAQRFRTLKTRDLSLLVKPTQDVLPQFCQQLAIKAPLYIAIILEQGAYPWTMQFLNQFDTEGVIQHLLEHQVLDVKPVVKHLVWCEWDKSIGFERLLDDSHG